MSGNETIRQDGDELELRLCQYLDGTLDRRGRLELERRLQTDPAVQRELHRYAALEEHLTALGRQEVPGVDYNLQRAEILAAVERKVLLAANLRRRLIFRPAVWGAMAAAAIVLIAVTAGVLVRRETPVPSDAYATTKVLPALPPPATGGQATVRLAPLDLEGPPLAPETPHRGADPAGTVVVWVSSDEAPDARPLDPMVFY